SRYFISDQFAEEFAQGLLGLERNWRGALLTNVSPIMTLKKFQRMEKAASSQLQSNWRFQQALYRAYYDVYTRSRLLYETDLEKKALAKLRGARKSGSRAAMSEAESMLERAVTDHVSRDWRARLFELAEALYRSIGMQLSVPRYKAMTVDRGVNLDNLDAAFNDRLCFYE